MIIEQSVALKKSYILMKEKLLKYEPQVKRKSIFPIATMLDPSFKLEYILTNEKEYITNNVNHLLQLMLALPILSTCSLSEPFLNTFTTCSKMMVELTKRKTKNINIVLEKLISHKIFDYFYDSQTKCSRLDALQ